MVFDNINIFSYLKEFIEKLESLGHIKKGNQTETNYFIDYHPHLMEKNLMEAFYIQF